MSVFIFHRVLPDFDPLLPGEPDATRFEAQVRFIARNFRVLGLADAVGRLERGTLPPAAAAITFDDGYADNLIIAAPILKRHGLTATFFIATGYIDGGRMWNDAVIESARAAAPGVLDWTEHGLGQYRIDEPASRVLAYQDALSRLKYRDPRERKSITDALAEQAGLGVMSDLMMTHGQLVELRNMGMEIGGHTVWHPILARLDDGEALAEIGAGREQLAEWLGEAPIMFAYPNGQPQQDYTRRDIDLVRRAGFAAAVSTAAGVAGLGSDVFQLPRFTPWDRGMFRFGVRCAMNYLH